VKTRRLVFLQAALIILAGWWVYFPALHGGWLWDDNTDITENPVLRDPAGIWKIWFAPTSLDFYPLKASVQWIQWRLWGLDPFGYHVTNVVLHLICALLLWRVLSKLGVRLAWLGGLLFVIHPMAVESVAWIVELKNVMSLAFLLGALLAYIDYDESKSTRSYGWAAALFLAAMLSKTSVVMFPFVLLLYCWWKRGRISRRDLKSSAPFFAISLGLGIVTLWLQQHRAIGAAVIPLGSIASRLAAAGLAAAYYLWKCVLPLNLVPIPPRWNVIPPSLLQFLPWIFFAALAAGLWSKRAGPARHALFALGFFLLSLAPILGFVTVSFMRITGVMDHLAYVALAGVVGLAAAGVGAALHRVAPVRRGWAIGAVAGICALLAAASHSYARVFSDNEGFWAYTLEHNPEAWVAEYNLGLALIEANRVPDAIGHFERALRLHPDYPEAENNLADALCETGRLAEAIPHFEAALRLGPDDPVVRYNFGLALRRLGRPAEAREQWAAAARLQAGR